MSQSLLAGAASVGSEEKLNIEDVFNSYLYVGNDSTQTITNGINLSGKGGLVWSKVRSTTDSHWLGDTVRGPGYVLESHSTNQSRALAGYTSFNTNGYSIIQDSTGLNSSSQTYVSWTFRKAPKFFDIVELNSSTTTYSHNLGSTPGVIMAKCTNASGANWVVWHKDFTNTTNNYITLNTTDSVQSFTNGWPSAPTDTEFSIDPGLWANGTVGIAYLFAHDAGGFGDSGEESIIKCGKYTGNGSTTGPIINLGWEPQWILIKRTDSSPYDWYITDNKLGIPHGGATGARVLHPNDDSGEGGLGPIDLLPTGFQPRQSYTAYNASGGTYIYIAIRRGPIDIPTDAATVFDVTTFTGDDASVRNITMDISPDLVFTKMRDNYGGSYATMWTDKLRGGLSLGISSTQGDQDSYWTISNWHEFLFNGYKTLYPYAYSNFNGVGYVSYGLTRAPSFFDVVAYTGDNTSNRSITHSLGVEPELLVLKTRSNADTTWYLWHKDFATDQYILFNSNSNAINFGSGNPNGWMSVNSSSFVLGYSSYINSSGQNYIAYLWSTAPGVSKVGSYTGTGTTNQIDCGFSNGARFVMIKRKDSNGEWYVWDTERGIVAGNDPYVLFNSAGAENTSNDYIDPLASGFEISSSAPAGINANGGTYIYLAIA